MATFQRATRKNAKLRLAVGGTAGAGKTYSALLLGKEFGTKIAVLDSERGSASLYAGAPGIPDFDVCELEEKNVQEYLEKIREAADAGYDVLIIDSYSHSWMGALEAVDKMGGWVKAGKAITPLVTKLVDAILSYPGHVIATMRMKAEHAIETVNGKATMKKLGMATVARDGTDYEFGVMLELTTEGAVTVTKTRCSALAGGVYTREDIPKIARTLKAWLSEGAPLAPLDEMKRQIQFAADDAGLQAVGAEIKKQVAEGKLTDEDAKALGPLYRKRKAEFQGAME